MSSRRYGSEARDPKLDLQMVRFDALFACLLLVALVSAGSSARAEASLASERAAVSRKSGPGLGQALAEAPSSPGIAIAVTLRNDDLPLPGAGRRALISARQQRVLDSLPVGSFHLRHRYESLSGLAGWAQLAAVNALLAHSESEFIYLDGTVHATLAQGSALIGASSVHTQGFTGSGVRVAVLDSGIDTDHPHLSDDIAAQQCF